MKKNLSRASMESRFDPEVLPDALLHLLQKCLAKLHGEDGGFVRGQPLKLFLSVEVNRDAVLTKKEEKEEDDEVV